MFCKTLTIDNETYTRLVQGEIKFPRQWVVLPFSERKARYVGVTPHGTLVVQHYEGGYCPEKFGVLLDYWRGTFLSKKEKRAKSLARRRRILFRKNKK